MSDELKAKIEEAYNNLVLKVKQSKEPISLTMKSGKKTAPLLLTTNGKSITFSKETSKVTSLDTILKICDKYPSYYEFNNSCKSDRSQGVGGYNNYHWAVLNELWKSIDPFLEDNKAAKEQGNGRVIDYAMEDAKNEALGRSGEEWVVSYERDRLKKVGKDELAKKIQHIAKEKGDGYGYDVLSFDENGKERFIEVKTTKHDKHTPFYFTENELKKSIEMKQQYYLYRVYDFDMDNHAGKVEIIQGDLGQFDCTPTEYRVTLK